MTMTDFFYVLKHILFYGALLVYFYSTKAIFELINQHSKIIVDEEFHLPQGLSYCNLVFDLWDPKITTFPGLYLLTAIVLAPLKACTVYNLRLLNLGASILNLFLFYILLGLYDAMISKYKRLLISINLSILPPLYFFSHVYYTDVTSLSTVLLMIIFNKKEWHMFASVFAFVSVLFRQTNIIWVVMVFGQYVMKEGFYAIRKSRSRISIQDIKHLVGNLKLLFKLTDLSYEFFLNFSAYAAVITSFAFFLYLNGGVVIGDKSAHIPVIHLPQIFYYAVFCLIFMLPIFIKNVVPFLQFVWKQKMLTAIILVLFLVIVHINTHVHLYLLSDNRHYTFYVWNRFYDKYFSFRYLAVAIYFYAFFCIFDHFKTEELEFIFTYIPCTIMVLMFQKLIEIRYFFIPYVLLRLRYAKANYVVLFIELIYYCLINAITLNIFVKKDVYWDDYDYPQKIIW